MRKRGNKLIAVIFVLAILSSVCILTPMNAFAVNKTSAASTVVRGDVDGSGTVTIKDATILQKYLARMLTLTADQLTAADVNQSGNVSLVDVTYIQMLLAKMISDFPIANNDSLNGENNIKLTVWTSQATLSLVKQQCANFAKLYPNKNITINVAADSESCAPADVLKDPSKAADVFGFGSDQLIKLYPALSPVPAANKLEVSSENLSQAVDACTYDNTLYAYPRTADDGAIMYYDKSVLSDQDVSSFEQTLKVCDSKGKEFAMDVGNGYYASMFMFTG
ncbi:MAG: dockerin type I domain-containing protein, partial [Bacillota bacterium]|nr:dockerin type I domain-containing protein [Bacillota bacterium]